MSSARARGWGDPGDPGYRRRHITTVHAGRVALAVRREVAHLFAGFVGEIAERGYPVDRVADDWGYAPRFIRGLEHREVWSNHAWGLAVDLNATTNPMGPVLRTDMPAWVILAAARWGLAWGGRYRRRPDAMHFEFVGQPGDVDRFPLAAPKRTAAALPRPTFPVLTKGPAELNDAERALLIEASKDASDLYTNFFVDRRPLLDVYREIAKEVRAAVAAEVRSAVAAELDARGLKRPA